MVLLLALLLLLLFSKLSLNTFNNFNILFTNDEVWLKRTFNEPIKQHSNNVINNYNIVKKKRKNFRFLQIFNENLPSDSINCNIVHNAICCKVKSLDSKNLDK